MDMGRGRYHIFPWYLRGSISAPGVRWASFFDHYPPVPVFAPTSQNNLEYLPPRVHPPPLGGVTVTGWFQKKMQQCHIAQDCIIVRARC